MTNEKLVSEARERAPRGRGHGPVLLAIADALEASDARVKELEAHVKDFKCEQVFRISEMQELVEAQARIAELEAKLAARQPSGDDRPEMSEHPVVAYHQWRKNLGRDLPSDDEGTAARIAFYAGWDHARAVTPGPDWEYGLRTRSKHDPARGFFSYAGDLETAWEMYGATYEHCTATIVRRRKAGPWLPVNSGEWAV